MATTNNNVRSRSFSNQVPFQEKTKLETTHARRNIGAHIVLCSRNTTHPFHNRIASSQKVLPPRHLKSFSVLCVQSFRTKEKEVVMPTN
jgi:hypothetical protein